MKVWLLQANEPMPIVNEGQRLFRMGMIAEELTKRNHEVTWFATTFNHFEKKQMYDKDTEIKVLDNYKLELIWAPAYTKNISIKRIINHKYMGNKFRKMARLMDKPDLIYCSFPTIDFAYEAVRYGKKNNVPVIIDVRDLWPDIFKHNLSGIKKIIALPYIKLMDIKTKKIMRQAFAINSISEPMLDLELEKGKRLKSKYDRYFYIGYDRKEIENSNVNNEIIDISKFNISFFGTINNQFDYDKIIEIAKRLEDLDDICINICGDGPQFEELKNKAKDCKNIRFLGWVDRATIDYILKNSKIGLAPYKDTFDFNMSVSNKFCEYISYGLPIVLTSGGYMKNLLEINNCGKSTQDVNEIFEFLDDLIENKNKYNEMSDNAKKLYEEKFIADKIYTDLVDYLEEINEEEK